MEGNTHKKKQGHAHMDFKLKLDGELPSARQEGPKEKVKTLQDIIKEDEEVKPSAWAQKKIAEAKGKQQANMMFMNLKRKQNPLA